MSKKKNNGQHIQASASNPPNSNKNPPKSAWTKRKSKNPKRVQKSRPSQASKRAKQLWAKAEKLHAEAARLELEAKTLDPVVGVQTASQQFEQYVDRRGEGDRDDPIVISEDNSDTELESLAESLGRLYGEADDDDLSGQAAYGAEEPVRFQDANWQWGPRGPEVPKRLYKQKDAVWASVYHLFSNKLLSGALHDTAANCYVPPLLTAYLPITFLPTN